MPPAPSTVKAHAGKATPPSLGAKGTIDGNERAERAFGSLKQKPGDPGPKPVAMVKAKDAAVRESGPEH